jgi:hypothetical protein
MVLVLCEMSLCALAKNDASLSSPNVALTRASITRIIEASWKLSVVCEVEQGKFHAGRADHHFGRCLSVETARKNFEVGK